MTLTQITGPAALLGALTLLGCAGRGVEPREAREKAAAGPRASSTPPGRAAPPGARPRTGHRAQKNPTRPRRTAPSGVKMIHWSTTARALRGKNGRRYVYGCPAGGSQSNVWGTGVYTDDSSICSAAVHAGQLTFARGGVVTIEILAGKSGYPASTQHGVTSASWGAWQGSFVFVGTPRPLPTRPAPRGSTKVIAWSTNARSYRNQVGKRFTLRCPANGRLGTVWGSAIYTDDSSICSAAVHAGRITVTRGGRVTIELQSGQSAYQGSARYGVTSRNWNAWSGSFIFVNASAP